MPAWRWAAGPASGSLPLVELARARSRKLSFRLDGRHTASLTVNGRSEEAANLAELGSDVWAWRDGVLMFRGRVVPTTDELDANRHNLSVTALSYLSILDVRRLYAGDSALVQSGVDQATIVWNLISATQGRTSGSLGITQGTNGFTAGSGNTGITRTRNYAVGAQIGRLITDLSNVINGFDVDIDPALKVQVYYPSRGTSRGAVLDYGGTIVKLRRSYTAGHFANTVAVTGAQGLAPAVSNSASLGSDTRGRWEAWISDSTVVEATTLTNTADGALAALSKPSYGWSATLRANTWPGSSLLWLGDTAKLRVNSPPRFNATTVDVRVVQVDISLDGTGSEDVQLTLEQQA